MDWDISPQDTLEEERSRKLSMCIARILELETFYGYDEETLKTACGMVFAMMGDKMHLTPEQLKEELGKTYVLRVDVGDK